MSYEVVYQGKVIGTNFSSREQAQQFISNRTMRAERNYSTIREYQIDTSGPKNYYVEEKDVSARVPGWYVIYQGTKGEAEEYVKKMKTDSAYRDVHLRVQQHETPPQSPGHGLPGLAQEVSRPDKGTRTAAEQAEIEQKHAQLLLKNIEEGKAQASEETIKKLKAQEKTQKQFTQEKILQQLRTGTTMSQYKTYEEIEREKSKAQQIAEHAAQATTAKEMIERYRELPASYQTPETLKSIATASAERQKDLKREEALQRVENVNKPNMVGSENIRYNISTNNLSGDVVPSQKSKELYQRLSEKAERAEYTHQFRAEGLEKAKYGIVAFSFGMLSGGAYVIKHPFEYVKGVGKFILHPLSSIGAIAEEAKVLPLSTSGKVTTDIIIGKGVVKGVKSVTPSGKAASVLKQVSKEKPPTIAGKQYYGFENVEYGLKTTEQVITPKYQISKPSKIVTSQYQVNVPKPSVSVAEAATPKTTYSYITTPSGTQYTTAARGPYFIRSVTEPAGTTTTKVFKGDVLLKTTKQESTPSVKFTEPLEQLKAKEYLTMEELSQEATAKLSTSKGVSALEKGKYEATGARAIKTEQYLQTKTKLPATKSLAKPILDLKTGKAGVEPKMIEITPTKYKYVDYMPEQKPIVKIASEEGIFVEKPAISKTTQVTKVKESFVIKFEEKIGRKPAEVVYDTAKEYGKVGKTTDIQVTPTALAQKGVTLKMLIQETIQKLRNKGIEARQRIDPKTKQPTNAIEVKKNGKWVKATEFRGAGREVEGEVLGEYVIGKQNIGEVTEIQKPKITPIKEREFYLPSYGETAPSRIPPIAMSFRESTSQKPESALRAFGVESPLEGMMPKSEIKLTSKPRIMQETKQDIFQEPRPKARQQSKLFSESKPVSEIMQQPITKTLTQQRQIPQQKQISRQMQEFAKLTAKPTPYQYYRYSMPPRTPILPPPFLIGAFSSSAGAMQKGFAAFIKRGGIFEQVSPVTSEQAALDIGARKTKTSLAATFKVMPVEGPVKDIDPSGYYKQYEEQFRPYRISKGQKQPLEKGTYIQKRSFRLGTKEEVAEIMRAKSMFGKKSKSKSKGFIPV